MTTGDAGAATGRPTSPARPPDSGKTDLGDDPRLRPVVPRLVRSAFGLALGTVLGLTLSALALVHAVFDFPAEDPLFVWLLGSSFLPGYEPTLRGAVAGLVWGMILGFSLGWLLAWARDAFLRTYVAWIAGRERLRANSRVLEDLL